MLAGLITMAACRPDDSPTPFHVAAEWRQPPTTDASAVAALRVTAADRPVAGARLQVQGFMSHPGMAPVSAAVDERGNGLYDARFRFTMAGDWIIRVTGTAPDGRAIDQQLDAIAVRPPEGR